MRRVGGGYLTKLILCTVSVNVNEIHGNIMGCTVTKLVFVFASLAVTCKRSRFGRRHMFNLEMNLLNNHAFFFSDQKQNYILCAMFIEQCS